MKKIPTIFIRDPANMARVTDECNPDALWVFQGEGVATEKFDGTACLVRDGQLYKRYDAKHGKTPPNRFEPAQPEPDPITGHWPGWLPVGVGSEDVYHREAWENLTASIEDGTYELVGPKVQGNPYALSRHQLWLHGITRLFECPREFNPLCEYLTINATEGIVWHHPDGRMAKIKRRDFGLLWPVK